MPNWFTRLRNWETDDANNIGITSPNHDEEDDNFAVGINASLNIAGLNSPTANISMGGFKMTTAGLATAATDYARLDQVQTRVVAYAADSVGSDAYAITLSPALAAYAVGQSFYFAAGTANTGAATLNINGLGAKTIKKDYNADLNDGDIAQNQIVHVVYDGTNFQLLTPAHGLITQNMSAIYAADGGGSDAYAITLVPAISSYSAGLMINFKANTLNTGAASLNVNGLGAKTIVKDGSLTLETGDIKASQIIQVIYDGTNFQMISPFSYGVNQTGSALYAADSGSNDTYVITLTPAPPAYVTGMVIRFKANTLNTGTCTLDVNSLGAITLKKFGTTNNLVTGDILANQIVEVIYDGTNFQMLSAVDDISNLTAKAVPSRTADLVKIWDTSGSTYKKSTPAELWLPPTGVPIAYQTSTLTTASTVAVTAATFSDTGLTVSITPSSASSTVLIWGYISVSTAGGNNAAHLRLVRGSTAICVATDAQASQLSASMSWYNAGQTIDTFAIPFSFVDSPATTSSTTYKIQFTSGATQNMYVNRSVTDTNNNTFAHYASTITAQELSA